MQQLNPADLAAWLKDDSRSRPYLLDVREPWEFSHCHIDGSAPMPMASVPARLAELPKDQDLVVICHHGVRSFHVARMLQTQGFTDVINLQGGVNAWAREIDRKMATY